MGQKAFSASIIFSPTAFRCYIAWTLLWFLLPFLFSCSQDDGLKPILDAGRIRVLTRNNAHCYYLYRDKPMGFEYDMAAAFAGYLGVRLELRSPAWEDLITELNRGSADVVAASMTVTPERSELAAFSEPYMTVQQQVVIHKDNRSIGTLEDLSGKTVHVRKGTSYERRLEELQQDGIALSIQRHDDVPTEEFIRMVAEKEIAVTVADSNIAMLNRRYYPDVRIALPLEEPQSLAWAVSPNQRELLSAVNGFFQKIKENGTYSKIYEKYYADIEIFDYVDLRKYHRRLVSHLPRYEPLIRGAAQKNGFDWRLIAAMIYQESHFDADARSHTGVRGLMQLTLATAREMGLKNRLDPAQSIQGGVNYLKRLHDRYPEAAPMDRIRIALASYNVGAGHISDAQQIAVEKGLNPNTWKALQQTLPLLRNKKYYAKSRYGYCRGTEPVQYVKRIYTYYDILKRRAIS